MKSRSCRQCGEALRGRIDKKFCSVDCKNTYHNAREVNQFPEVEKINRILRRNYRILRQLNSSSCGRMKRDILEALGFNFSYYTKVCDREKGTRHFFIYDLAYCLLNEHELTLEPNGEYDE
jgi:hypothetical protein